MTVHTWFIFAPVITGLIAALFAVELFGTFFKKRDRLAHLWWGIGISCYGLGNFLQGFIAFTGWQEWVFKSWYISGALFGPAPLAIGALYKIGQRTYGHLAVLISMLMVVATGLFVLLSPVQPPPEGQYFLNGEPFQWQFVRRLTPFLNVSATLVLSAIAVLSAVHFSKLANGRSRAVGNALIGFTTLITGAAGILQRFGHPEWFYSIQCLGIILLWLGYYYGKQSVFAAHRVTVAEKSETAAATVC